MICNAVCHAEVDPYFEKSIIAQTFLMRISIIQWKTGSNKDIF